MNPIDFDDAEGMGNRRDFLGAALAGLGLGASGCSTANRTASVQPTAQGSIGAILKGGEGHPSDLGNLFAFVQSQAVDGEFPLSFLQDRFRSVESWKKRARGRFLELLHYSPPPCDPRGEVLDRVDLGDHTRETVHFNTTPNLRVPAWVLVPKGLTNPAPAIVALHDHGGFYFWGREKITEHPGENPVLVDFKRNYYGGKSIATELVRQGYIVVVIDMFYWGERRLLLADDPPDWKDRPAGISKERIQAFNARASQNEQLLGRSIYAAGFTWPGVIFWDDIRTVDYLLTRPDVDPKRIGCVGLSVGGLRACHLAALDDRVKAGVVVGWMASFPWQLKRHIRNTIGHTKVVPGLYREMDYPDVASMTMPKPVLVINGSRDGLFHLEGVKASFAKLHACYGKAGAGDRIRTTLYDTPHEFNVEMQKEAWEWLKRWV